jgi:outer membrane immunogenic protein
MEPDILNKSLASAKANDSRVLHFGDCILAGIIYFRFRKLDGLSNTALEQERFKKNHEAHKNRRMMMKKFLLGTVGLVALGIAAGPASAADLAARPVYTKAPPMVAAAYDWSGFYIGINGGWAQDHDRRTDPVFGLFGDYDSNGGTVGGQVGYRWQTGPIVFGLEAQGNWADLNGSTANLLAPGTTIRSNMDAFGLFTGQIGYAWNSVLLYAKGGAAVTDRNFDFFAPGVIASTGYDTRWSPTVGAGLEYAFAPSWSVGVEYNHIFEGRHDASFVAPGFPAFVERTGGDTDMVLGRLNYRWGGPVIGKY